MTDMPAFRSVPARLGITASVHGGDLVITLDPRPEVRVHGMVRASVLAYVVDAVAGITVDRDPDRWSFTTDLSLRARPRPAPPEVRATTTVLRRGGRSVTCAVELVDGVGGPVGSAAIGFAHVARRPGDPPKPVFSLDEAVALFAGLPGLALPLRQEAGIQVLRAAEGVVEMAVTPELCNPAGTLQGAMVALVGEAAAEELASARAGTPMVVVDLDVRFLAQARSGAVRTRSRLLGDAPGDPVEVAVEDDAGTVTTLVHARAVPAPAQPGATPG